MEEKLAIIMAGLKEKRVVADICCEHKINGILAKSCAKYNHFRHHNQ